MKKLLLALIVTVLFIPQLFAAPGGGPYNNDYPCPDLDCSTTADTWAGGMTGCSVYKSKNGYCVSCDVDAATNNGVCVKSYASASCKCKYGSTGGTFGGKRTCKGEYTCNYYAS